MNIVITGAGIVSAIGCDKPSVLESLLRGRSGITTMQRLPSAHRELPVGEVKLSNDQLKDMLGIAPSLTVSRTALLGMLAVSQAIDESGVAAAAGRRIVLVSGTTVGGMDVTEQHFDRFTTSDERPDCLLKHDCGSCTQDMADHFGLFTDCTTVSTACSSAANALILGAELLKAGEADMVVAGGTEALTRFHLNGFNSLMILDHQPCRPFDAERAGLNLGEGAAYVVMESEASARARGADIHAWLTGYGNACDAFHQTASSDDGEGAWLAMREALSMAGLQPRDIDYVNAHGTGTPNNDQSETAALRRIFADQMPPVSSTKGFTGHATSASGSIEAVICLLAMRHHFLPVNYGWRNPMPDGIIPVSSHQPSAIIHHVLCNSFGFGGNDSSLVLSDRPVASEESSFRPVDVRIAATVEITDLADLAEIKNYVKPLEARRMGTILKSSLLASLKALELAGIDTPDAIITATSLGCIENTERLLLQLRDEGETSLKPTCFMQSTHNTIGSNIAIRTRCHGYNTTYSHGAASLSWALRDARRLLSSGRVGSVLVGQHDETTPLYRQLMAKLGVHDLKPIYSKALILTCGR